jgi:hypothetical protein
VERDKQSHNRAALRSAFVVLGYLEYEILNSELVVHHCDISLRRQSCPTTSSVVLVPSIAAEISDGGALNSFWMGGLLEGLYRYINRSLWSAERAINDQLETNNNYRICEIHAINTVNSAYYSGEGLLLYRLGRAKK